MRIMNGKQNLCSHFKAIYQMSNVRFTMIHASIALARSLKGLKLLLLDWGLGLVNTSLIIFD
jgi:hypothetical protein